MRSLVILAVIAACGGPPAPASPMPPRDLSAELRTVTVEELVGLYEACTSPLTEATAITIEPNGTRWAVTARGRTVVIDFVRRTCNAARAVEAPAVLTGTSVDRLLATAIACAKQAPWHGLGTGKSPLVFDHPRIHRYARLVVEFDEAEPMTKPPGAELYVDLATGRCEPTPRE